MSIKKIIIALFIALFVTGCASPRKTVIMDKHAKEKVVQPVAFYVLVVGNTRYTDDDETIEVGKIFQEKASERLQKLGVLAAENDGKNHYVIHVNIISYRPGNAAGRYFAGQFTNSFDSSIIIHAHMCEAIQGNNGIEAGNSLARIPTNKDLHEGLFGGIGGWESVIVDAAWDLINTVEEIFLDD
jgi:hypothetical protein